MSKLKNTQEKLESSVLPAGMTPAAPIKKALKQEVAKPETKAASHQPSQAGQSPSEVGDRAPKTSSETTLEKEPPAETSPAADEPLMGLVEAAQINAAESINRAPPAIKNKAHGQTGPKSQAGKNRARWNALKDGLSAKSLVLPFEDERLYQRHIQEIEQALIPSNYVEVSLVREYADGLWRLMRHEKRGVYEREDILKSITPTIMAQVLGLEDRYIKSAPDFLVDLKYKISKKLQQNARLAFSQYEHLIKNAKGIANFNMVFSQYHHLFEELNQWVMAKYDNVTPIVNNTGAGLSLIWQQQPQKLLSLIEGFANHVYFVAYFEDMKPEIRVFIESWFFLQKTDMRRLENLDLLAQKERSHTHSLLDKLIYFRKSHLFQASAPSNLSGFEEGQKAA